MKVVYRSNKSRTDRGWDDMRRLLDHEMPQKPNRKRPVLLWFFLLISTGLAVSLYINQPGQRAGALTINQNNTTSQQPAASLLQQPATPTIAIATRQRQYNSEASNDISIPVSTNITNLTVRNNPEPTSVTDIPAEGAHEPISSINGVQPALRFARAAIDLPLHPIPPAEKIIRKKSEKRPLSRQFKLGLTVGAILGQVKATPNLTAGIHLDYRPAFARHWGVRTGLAYRSQLFSGESRPIIPVSYDQYYRATFNQDIFPDTVSANWYVKARQNNVLVPVNKVHRLDIPLLVYWESRFHLKAMAGANFSRAVAINSAQNSYFTYDLNILKTPSDEAHSNLNNAMLNLLPPWEVQLQGGLAYSFNRHFEIGLHYRSSWMQKDPIIEEALDAYSNCLNCLSTYPIARQRTVKALRPQSLLLSAQFSF